MILRRYCWRFDEISSHSVSDNDCKTTDVNTQMHESNNNNNNNLQKHLDLGRKPKKKET